MQEPEIARNRLSYLWLLPVIALGIGLWLAYSHLSQIGPVIRIAFTSAEGLDAGKTKIRYKDLEVGTITRIDLSHDLKQIIVTAQMQRTAEALLKKTASSGSLNRKSAPPASLASAPSFPATTSPSVRARRRARQLLCRPRRSAANPE